MPKENLRLQVVMVLSVVVPAGSPSRGGEVTVDVPDLNQPSLPTLSILFLSLSVFMALATLFYSTNSPDNSPLSHSVLTALFCLTGPLNDIFLY